MQLSKQQCDNVGGTWTSAGTCDVTQDPWAAYTTPSGDYNITKACHASDAACLATIQTPATAAAMIRQFAAHAAAVPFTPQPVGKPGVDVCITNLVMVMSPMGYAGTPATDVDRIVDGTGWADMTAGQTCPPCASAYFHPGT